MKRNDVVMEAKPDQYRFYGRIVKIIGEKALWICTGRHIHLTPLKDLEKVDYKGIQEWGASDGWIRYFERNKNGQLDFEKVKYKRPPHFDRMPTLRKLKQMASRYHGRNVWNTSLYYDRIIL